LARSFSLVADKEGTMNELALFAGAGGGILGGHLLGWRTVCAVEWEPYPASVLCARQNDGLLPPFPIWDDVQTFDGKPWRGIVDVVSGGFPCQDISAAGKGAGIDGERSGMWREMARVIREVRPRFVFVENSPMLTSRGLGVVLGDLAKMGFDAKWGVLGAADVGAPHQRDRIWIAGWRDIFPHAELHRLGWREQQSEGVEKTEGNLANTKELLCDGGNDNAGVGLERESVSEPRNCNRTQNVANTQNPKRRAGQLGRANKTVRTPRNNESSRCCWWQAEPNVGRVVDGLAARVDRLKAIGNGQVPLVAATAWEELSK
jgi:DNA (cytosine-5)-methyltransferase 1